MTLTGLFPHPGDFLGKPVAADGCVFEVLADEIDSFGEASRTAGEIHMDGTCSREIVQECSRAAWSYVVSSVQGRLLAVARGPVWAGLPQTPQVAEHAA